MTSAVAAGAETSQILMPGGGVTRRPLHFIVMADCSGSMKGEKMQALNYALRSMLPHLLSWEGDQLQAQLLIRVLAFATRPCWHLPAPTSVAELSAQWRDLEFAPRGLTNMGPAFRAVAEVLGADQLERRALCPAIYLPGASGLLLEMVGDGWEHFPLCPLPAVFGAWVWDSSQGPADAVQCLPGAACRRQGGCSLIQLMPVLSA